MLAFLFLHDWRQMRRDARHAARHAGGMILTEYGLHFRCEGDHWRCVERPDLQMLPGPEPYSVGERAFGSLDEALRRLEAIRRVRASALLDHEKCGLIAVIEQSYREARARQPGGRFRIDSVRGRR